MVARLVGLGAQPPDGTVPAAWWLAQVLDAIGAVSIRHPGDHRYAWQLRRGRAARLGLPGLPYPKAIDPIGVPR